ncbi:MAG TPA: hypothetical protein VGJ43_07685 [Acidimicrobiales bacterium]
MHKSLTLFLAPAVPVLLAAGVLAARGGGGEPAPARVPVEVDRDDVPRVLAAADPEPAAPAPEPLAVADCGGDAMMRLLQSTTDVPLLRIDVRQCRNGYARALMVPDAGMCGEPEGSCYETEQVFLTAADGDWAVVTSGTGIACSDTDAMPDLVAACVALGLR